MTYHKTWKIAFMAFIQTFFIKANNEMANVVECYSIANVHHSPYSSTKVFIRYHIHISMKMRL